MASKNTTRKPADLQPVQLNPYEVAMRKLGLDWPAIDRLADEYTSAGDDSELVLTIILLQRLRKLAEIRTDAPISMDNYLDHLIDRLYRATNHCQGAATHFAQEADQALRAAHRPRPVSERRVS